MEKEDRLRSLGSRLIPNYSDIYYKNQIGEKINDLIKKELIKESESNKEKTDNELMQLVKTLIKKSDNNNYDLVDAKFKKIKSNTTNYRKFKDGDMFIDINNNKVGTVNNLRNDTYEQSERQKDSTHYMYSVTYDDGTFETYLSQNYMEPYNSGNLQSQPKKVTKVSKKKVTKVSKKKAPKVSKKKATKVSKKK